jgi:hypothetical protein
MIVNDPRGRTPKELAGMDAALGSRSRLTRRDPETITLIGGSHLPAELGPVPAAITASTVIPGTAFDATNHPSARIIADVAEPGSAGTKGVLRVNTGTGWVNPAATGEIEVPLDTATPDIPALGGDKVMSSATIGDKPYKVFTVGGDGVTIPKLRGLQIQFLDKGRRVKNPCNSSISAGADVYENFCSYADLEAFANAYGYFKTGDDPLTDYWEQTGDGYIQFDGTNYALYMEHLGRHWLDQVSLVQTPFNGGHKAHVIDMPAGTVARGSARNLTVSEWQIEGATVIVTPRAEVTVKFNLETMDDLAHIGSQFELAMLRFLWNGTGTAAMRLLVRNETGTARLYAQRITTPSGGSGPLNDLGPASDVLGAGDLKCSIEGVVSETPDVTFNVYLYGAESGGVHAPIYTETVAGAYDRFQTARMLEAFLKTPIGAMDGAFKLTTYELDLVNGSVISL